MSKIDDISDFLLLGSKHYYSSSYLKRKKKEESLSWEEPPTPQRSKEGYVDFFRQLRMRANITQQELASRMRTSQSTISEFESGWGNPTLAFLNRYCEALNISVEITFKSRTG